MFVRKFSETSTFKAAKHSIGKYISLNFANLSKVSYPSLRLWCKDRCRIRILVSAFCLPLLSLEEESSPKEIIDYDN